MKEITPEIKQRIFALYWGQNVWGTDLNDNKEKIGYDDINTIESDCRLWLTPLSHISEEDAIEVVKIKYPIFSELECKVVKPIKSNQGIRVVFYREGKPCEYSEFTEWNLNISQIDFLRFLGYALPYLNWSVDDLVKAGVFKLKENPAKTQ